MGIAGKKVGLKRIGHRREIRKLGACSCSVVRTREEVSISVMLIGNTVGMVEIGLESTKHVTI